MNKSTSLVATGMVLFSSMALSAAEPPALRLAAIFGDNMVLQRDKPVRVWGWAAPNDGITVTFAGQDAKTSADADGRWLVTLAPMAVSSEPRAMSVRSSLDPRVSRRSPQAEAETSTLSNILVGDVWLCSGQSNMELSLGAANGAGPVQDAKYPQMRLFVVGFNAPQKPADDCKGKWVECSPQTVGAFSAVGYYFGRKLHQELGVPVGLIQAALGATEAECWVDRSALESDPVLRPIVERLDTMPKDPKGWDPHLPTGLFNGEIAPLTRLALRGVIWYQGESNASRAFQYRTLFAALIRDWRRAWGEDLPFYFVQLANHLAPASQPADEPWAELREAQAMALRLPNTGMAVAIDIGAANNIHPPNKWDVGARLAACALSGTYGRSVVGSGPRYQSMAVEGPSTGSGQAHIRVSFDHVGGGLVAKGGVLKRFAVAGEDKRYVWADAAIDGDTVVISSPRVAKPVAARYAWANNPEGCNLYNAEGFPAAPFRTDTWPGVTDKAHLQLTRDAIPATPGPRRSQPVPSGAFTGNTLQVAVGAAVARPWDEVKTDGYTYAPRQSVEASRETHVWLPYGPTKGVYYDVSGFVLTDPQPGNVPALVSQDPLTFGRLVLKFRFDKPIRAFRFQGGYAEFKPQNAVAGVEYSLDGAQWAVLQQTDRGGIHNLLVDPKIARAEGLRTQDLYLRCFTRDRTRPEAAKGQGAWVKSWMGGDPSWGDASRTFFDRQWQLWVTAAE